ncbi:MAG: UDP-2,3-diacylglucosamine diphosphatase LpxI [Candidatus Omnitrophica bacterium]|nr:UDP-2,3-diacylglucosamine diphosphatase LpxI [Candidatus Omnitrophota bacterium]
MHETLGIITGNGKLPELILKEVKKSGYRVVLCAIQGETDPTISSLADKTEWIRLGQLGRVIKFFEAEGVREAIMAGKITKTNLFRGDVRPDLEMIKAIGRVKNHSDDSLLGGIVDHLGSRGIQILDTTRLLSQETLPQKGVLTARKPSKREIEDIEFGWHLAKEMGRLDIGQTVVIKNKAVLAVEAVEGTDEAILRGGALGAGDVVVVKVSKPKQDMRFDVPTIGLGTLAAMIRARACALAFEAGKTIVLERRRFIEKANRHKITVLGKGG